MRALIVGSGAVGQVYGLHLARGGASVAVFVRPKHAAEARRGYDLFRIHGRARREAASLVPDEVLTDVGALSTRAFDQVWLCVPTTSLVDGSLAPLLGAILEGPSRDATIVCLQPGSFVGERLAAIVPVAQTVFGVISMTSFHAPLEGSTASWEQATGPGTAYFFPPLNPNVFSGVGDRAARVVDALRMGGAPASVVPDARVDLAFSSALLMPAIAALEAVGWSLERFRASPECDLAARGAQEAATIMSAELGRDLPPWVPLFRPFVLKVALGFVGPRLAPFDLEAFLRVHFEKVGAQTRLMFDQYIAEGARRGVSTEALAELRGRLARLDGDAAPRIGAQ